MVCIQVQTFCKAFAERLTQVLQGAANGDGECIGLTFESWASCWLTAAGLNSEPFLHAIMGPLSAWVVSCLVCSHQ